MTILDSGERREFESGAVRDIQEGKGRCDLLPLDILSDLLSHDTVLYCLNLYVREGNIETLISAIKQFVFKHYPDPPTAYLELAKHYEDGANKYAERNWELGISLHCYIDSGIRHYLKLLRGDTDEPHDRAFLWNMLGAAWTHRHKPELIDLPFAKENNNESDSRTTDI